MSVDIGRPFQMSLNPENMEELAEFLDGLVLANKEHSGPRDMDNWPKRRTLFLSSIGLSTSDIFIQMEAPHIFGKPKVLVSVVGIEAKASLKPDLQGMLDKLLCFVLELILRRKHCGCMCFTATRQKKLLLIRRRKLKIVCNRLGKVNGVF